MVQLGDFHSQPRAWVNGSGKSNPGVLSVSAQHMDSSISLHLLLSTERIKQEYNIRFWSLWEQHVLICIRDPASYLSILGTQSRWYSCQLTFTKHCSVFHFTEIKTQAKKKRKKKYPAFSLPRIYLIHLRVCSAIIHKHWNNLYSFPSDFFMRMKYGVDYVRVAKYNIGFSLKFWFQLKKKGTFS